MKQNKIFLILLFQAFQLYCSYNKNQEYPKIKIGKQEKKFILCAQSCKKKNELDQIESDLEFLKKNPDHLKKLNETINEEDLEEAHEIE